MTEKNKGRHYKTIIADDLYPGRLTMPEQQGWPPRHQHLTYQMMKEMMDKLNYIMNGASTDLRTLMSEKIELYNNVIESKYGVKLCISQNHDSDMTSMLLLVPNQLFADDQGKELLADALHNIAQFILSLE